MNIKKYFKVWGIYAINSFQTQLVVRWAVALFFFAKIIRFFIFTFFIVVLFTKTNSLAGYTLDQTILFYLSFNLVDIITQLLFREVYRFRPAVVTGAFDFYLIKPISALFRSLTAGPDLIDFATVIPLVIAVAYFMDKLQLISFIGLSSYILLLVVGFVIGLSFHILVLSLAIITTEIDSAVMLYRDITSLGRMPIDIYTEPIRGLLTFVIPVGIMMSFPAKSLLGLLSPTLVLYALIFAAGMFYLSNLAWRQALKKYSSASS